MTNGANKDIVWEAFHITIPQLEREIKILIRRIMELEKDEMQNGYSVKAHIKRKHGPPKGD